MAHSYKISELKQIALALPGEPGVYQFFDKDNQLIYVGKAKNLKHRVASYFNANLAGKTLVMRNKINSIKHIIVDSESEALLLENTLIKENQPRYNVLLKDDKTYPWICIKNENFPRVFMTRNIIRDGSEYYGPYTSVVMVKTLLGLIRQLYSLRNCALKLSGESIDAGKFKVCLEYHIGNCKAPCIAKQSEDDYNISIEHIREILKGNIFTVTKYLKNLMNSYSSELKFEEAQLIKEKLDILEKYRSKSTVVNTSIKNLDVFACVDKEKIVYFNYLRLVKGAIIQTQTLEIKRRLDEKLEELMSLAITEIRARTGSESREVVVSLIPDIQIDGLKYIRPQRGDKLRLLELAERNIKFYILNKENKYKEKSPSERHQKNLENLKKDLRLPELPRHIECFDNSNIQGSDPVAACVVFRNNRPSKKEYRHYNIKTVVGPDDYASMTEVVYRRYKRLKEEGRSLPQLIVIDGGKGQLNAAVKSLDMLSLRGKISIVGIAKRLEEIYFPGDPVPVYIDKNSFSLKIIQQLRNEAHRFGISFHRQKRSKGMIQSELDQIPGVGVKTKELLIQNFKSVEKIRQLSKKELEKILARSKAEKIYDYFHKSI